MKPMWGHSVIRPPIVMYLFTPFRFLARPQLLTRR
jgi:hypothetical protein